MCDDGIGCTADTCGRATPSAPVTCIHTPWAVLCTPPGDANTQSCILPRCTVAGVRYGNSLTWPTGSPNIQTGVDSRGCSFLQRSDYCTNTWDSCDCNARETCAPGSNNMDATGCRNSPRMTGSATGTGSNAWAGNYPCDADKKYCTFGLCCEPDIRCRDLELTFPDPTARQNAVSHCGQTLVSGVWTPPLPLTNRVSPTGNTVRCSTTDLWTMVCPQDDGKPCTTQTCHEPLADGTQGWGPQCPGTPLAGAQPGCDGTASACSYRTCTNGGGECVTAPYPVGPRAGCEGLTNEECGTQQCNGAGYCDTLPSNRAVTACSASSGTWNGVPACAKAECSYSFCQHSQSDALCPDDGLSCTAPSVCGNGFVCSSQTPNASSCVANGACHATGAPMPDNDCRVCAGSGVWAPRPSGYPCDDNNSCTDGDACNSTGSCMPGAPVSGCPG
jgi:hypothetical protein